MRKREKGKGRKNEMERRDKGKRGRCIA